MHYLNGALAVLIILSGLYSQAKQIAIFDSRKPVTLSKQEKAYIDFYINAGTEVGIKRGILITAVRSTSLYDAYQNKSPGDLMVPVGQLKIIHVQKGLSVARVHKIFSRKNLPVLDHDYIMVGDRLDLNSMTREKKKSVSKSAKMTVPQKKTQSSQGESVDFASNLPAKTPIILPNLQ
jgi:hypothetical protein